MDAPASLNAALVGRYLIEREIGRGGMATVYLARDLRHHRRVALKVLDPELAAVLGSERFLSEIRVTANLQHPHLLPLFDSGEAYGLLFYVMPYVEGESLRARLDREKQLPVDEAIRITAAVLSALEYAHARGVIHRDLKPGNILLHSGEPVVADFGIALAVSNAGGARITQTGLSLGTPQYMSPEQATGDRMIDARSDIYSVGAVLYEMLVGEPPHTGATVQAIIAKVVTERPRSVRLARDTVPESVDFAVAKALAKLPADRWPTARDFAESLHDTAPVFTAPVQRLSAAVEQVRRLPSLVFWRAVSAVLLVAAATLGWLAVRPREAPPGLQLARQLTFDGNVVGTAISPDGAWLAYVIDDCHGQEFSCTRTLQVREVDGSQSVKLLTWPSMGSDVRWSADGAMIGFVGSPDSTASALYLVPRLGGTPRRVAIGATAWTFGANGRLLVVAGPAGRQALLSVDARTLARGDSLSLPSGFLFRDLDVTSSGQWIAASANGRTPTLLVLDDHGRLLDSTTAFSVRSTVRWDASNTGILITTAAPGTADDIRRVPVSRGKLDVAGARIALGQVQDGADGLIDVARSGRVAVVAGPTTFEIFTLRLGDPAASWTSISHHTSWVWAQAFSPDESSIVGSATDNMGENVYVFPAAGGSPRALSTQHGIRDFPFWSADGRHVGYNALGPESIPVGVMFTDLTGGRERSIRSAGNLETVTGWMGSDALVLFQPGALTVVDTAGTVRRRIALPDSLAPTPWSRIIGSPGIHTDAVAGRSFYWSAAAGAVIAVDLSTGQLSRLVATTTPVLPVGSGSDGTLYVTGETAAATAGPAGAAPRRDRVIERLPPGGSTFVRIATLPSGCWTETGAVTVSRDGRVAACTVRRYAPDVWLADRGGRSGW